jgi:hypothetical protein
MPYSDQLVLYCCYVYPQIVVCSGINNAQIVVSPLSVEDNLAFKDKQPTAHASALNTHDLVGYGLMGKMHRLMTHPRLAHKMRKSRMQRRHLRDAIKSVMPNVSSGMGMTGGRTRSRKSSRKSVLKF